MPRRKHPLVNDHIYHVYNRGINRISTFTTENEFSRALQTINYYRFENTPLKLSAFLNLTPEEQSGWAQKLKADNDLLVDIASYCLMFNHFHFILKQRVDGGISKFVGNFQNSYTRFFNTKRDKQGGLFNPRFKAVQIETDEQLVHCVRYVLINPYTSGVVKEIGELLSYPYSSLQESLADKNADSISDTKLTLSLFRNKYEFKKFLLDQVDYQRDLHKIKHITFE